MNRIIDVQTGEVRTVQGKVTLKSRAIGSCIAIVAYDSINNIGAMAHTMLPSSAPADKKPNEKTKYSANAIDAMVSKMSYLGTEKDDIEVVLVGGGNVLKKKDDTVCKDNIESTIQHLKEKHIPIRATALGGTERRGVCLNVESGCVSSTEGDEKEKLLWKCTRENIGKM